MRKEDEMFERMAVEIPEWMVHGWWIYAYKIPPPIHGDILEMVRVAPDERFEAVVSKWVTAVVREGAMPPADIAPAIFNLANDLVSGREMTIRTGDYIAIQRHLRKG
jgi:hypothetical protein